LCFSSFPKVKKTNFFWSPTAVKNVRARKIRIKTKKQGTKNEVEKNFLEEREKKGIALCESHFYQRAELKHSSRVFSFKQISRTTFQGVCLNKRKKLQKKKGWSHVFKNT